MTRLALIGDVHLTQSKNKEFEANRFLLLCKTINTKEYDMVIFMGDLFDRARPTLEEIAIVRQGIALIDSTCVVLDGNHEAVNKTESTYDYIDIPRLAYLPFNMLQLEGLNVFLMGYKHINNYVMVPKCDILLSHFRSNMGIIKEEVPTEEIAKRANLVTFLGDIHQEYSPLSNVHYTSSPYGIHFSKEQHTHGYIELSINEGTYEYKREALKLPTKVILDMTPLEIRDNILKLDTKNLYRIRVQGTSEELEKLPELPYVQYITSLTLKEEDVTIDTKTDILEALIAIVGEAQDVRYILTQVYNDL